MCILLKIYCHLSFSSCSEQKCLRSKKYAAEHGLPVLKNVLLPKTKGFCACLQELRSSLAAGCPICLYFICLYYIIIGKVCDIRVIHSQSLYSSNNCESSTQSFSFDMIDGKICSIFIYLISFSICQGKILVYRLPEDLELPCREFFFFFFPFG